jgi:hypothetical protein
MIKHLEKRVVVDNRYALTDIHVDDFVGPGRRRYGLWKAPAIKTLPELPLSEGTYFRYTITAADIGRIDLIAWRHYQDVNLWWVIARCNGIANPFEDLVIGRVLLIPYKALVVQAIEQGRTFV